MKFGIIGTGLVGTALAVRLEEVGHECVGVHTRSHHSYERFHRYSNKEQMALERLIPLVDCLFITTQDSNIRNVAELLCSKNLLISGQAWIHCSGSLPSDILKVRDNLPVRCLSLHPLQAFASVDNALEILPGTHFGIEGDDWGFGEVLVKDLGGIPHHILASQKALYHAGAVVASNYLVVLASLAVELFAEAGFQEGEALQSLMPLMTGTLYNLQQVGLPRALTGPIARGDAQVVQSHLDHMPLSLDKIYRELGLKALELGKMKKTLMKLSYAPEELSLMEYLLGNSTAEDKE